MVLTDLTATTGNHDLNCMAGKDFYLPYCARFCYTKSMQIDIPQSEQDRLAQHAAAGYDDVERYAAEHLVALAHQPTPDELPQLAEEELQASLAMCDESMAEFEAGGGLSIGEARELSLQRLRQLAP